jgi:hypothetical protein
MLHVYWNQDNIHSSIQLTKKRKLETRTSSDRCRTMFGLFSIDTQRVVIIGWDGSDGD